LIIKLDDKGGAIVLLDVEQYIAEAYRQLLDIKYYKELDEPLQRMTLTKIRKLVIDLQEDGFLNEKQFRFLFPSDFPRPRKFYLLPKAHTNKTNGFFDRMPPSRPIVSNINSESSEIFKHVDFFLRHLADKHQSCVKELVRLY